MSVQRWTATAAGVIRRQLKLLGSARWVASEERQMGSCVGGFFPILLLLGQPIPFRMAMSGSRDSLTSNLSSLSLSVTHCATLVHKYTRIDFLNPWAVPFWFFFLVILQTSCWHGWSDWWSFMFKRHTQWAPWTVSQPSIPRTNEPIRAAGWRLTRRVAETFFRFFSSTHNNKQMAISVTKRTRWTPAQIKHCE